MFSDKEFQFKTKWTEDFRQPGDTFWIALNYMKMRPQYSGSGLLVTRECSSIEELEKEVDRLKADLDHALSDARKHVG